MTTQRAANSEPSLLSGEPEEVSLGQGPSDLFGRRLRHARRAQGLTLREVAERVQRSVPYLSQVENGHRVPNLTLARRLADALGVSLDDLLVEEAPDRRTELELRFERIRRDPAYQELGLPELRVTSRTADEVLEHVVTLFDSLKKERQVRAATPEEVRRANLELRLEMRARDNYFAEIEELARDALHAVGHDGPGPVAPRTVSELVRRAGYRVEQVADLPSSMRSLTDLHARRILIPQRNEVDLQSARSILCQTLGHLLLEHQQPRSIMDFLRQRVEANYFAGALLVPEVSAVPFLIGARERNDLSVEELAESYNVSYEMAGHRFTNLATRHLDLGVHFIRSDEHGVVWKAYENNGVPFNRDVTGAVEGQRLCRHWGTRRVFETPRTYDIRYQYTETPAGVFWCATLLEVGRQPQHAVTVGTTFSDAKFFRGRLTRSRAVSGCPDPACCQRPGAELAGRWSGLAWPSPRGHSHLLASLPAGSFPGVDLAEAYEYLEARRSEEQPQAVDTAASVAVTGRDG